MLAFLQQQSRSPCAPHFCSYLNPPAQKLWCLQVFRSLTVSRALCRWWLPHLCMTQFFSATITFQEDQAEPSELAGKRWYKASETQGLAYTPMNRMTNFLLRRGQGSLKPLIFVSFSESAKSHLLSPLRWQMTLHCQGQRNSAAEITH